MKYHFCALAFGLAFAAGVSAEPASDAAAGEARDAVLWYNKPATRWEAEALPIGNGRLGAMIFGGAAREHIQFNEDSLWTGDACPSGVYEKMGAYQNFGDLFIRLDSAAAESGVACPSGHAAFDATEDVASTVDGQADTKWCVEHNGKPVVWETRLPRESTVEKYSLTSANDIPARDPSTWELSGSNDGQEWSALDRHEKEPPFAQRGETITYSVKQPKAFRLYRLTFTPNPDAKHFQVAEIKLTGAQTEADGNRHEDYRRDLDIASAVAGVSFTANGVRHHREMFASHPAELIVIRWTADKPGAVSGILELKGAHRETSIASWTTLSFLGTLENGLNYEAALRIVTQGGKVEAAGDQLHLQGCDAATLLLALGTDYASDAARNFRGTLPHGRLAAQLESAAAKSYEQLKSEHVADYQSLFNRVAIDLGAAPEAQLAMPTDERLKAYASAATDNGLEGLLFQYGRYLLISSSRRPGLPANLQGLWNESNSPPWSSDYHANINVQMNYWPAEPANLSECHLPLFDLIQSQLPLWRKATQAEPEFKIGTDPVRGWALRTSHNIYGGLGWKWDKTANAWYCQHLWWHYEFSRDREYLRSVAYPILKEICEFWQDHLKTLPDGRLVVPNAWSPEHGPDEDGVSYSQEIVWDLFNNYVEAADTLAVDGDYRDAVATMRDKLVTPKIGKWGQLQEWMVDRDEPKDEHRHTSHLFAVYPGRQISMTTTPDLAKAAAVSLEARGTAGDSRRSWTWPWRTALWARLRNPEKAHAMVQGLLTYNILPNLFGNHPPFQMDGNFGITAGICEMLLQSHADEIELLPALPKAWQNGSVKGLRARGNVTVDIEWRDGKVTHYRLSSATPSDFKVRVNGEVKQVATE
jgi:alpha-L-fucosidase 2